MNKSFFVHNLQINIFTNSRFILKIITDNLELIQSYPRPSNPIVINLHLREADNYRQIPMNKLLDGFRAYPIYQREYFDKHNLTMDVGARTVKVIISPKENSSLAYISAPEVLEKDLLFDLIFFQPLTTLLKFHKLYLFHSSAVAKKNKCVLFTGTTGAGKSVLALSLLKSGFSYLSDDDVILQSRGLKVECLSFPTKMKLKRNLLKYFPFLKNQIQTEALGNKGKLNLKNIYPHIIIKKALPSIIVFPHYKERAKARLIPLSSPKSLQRLLKENYIFYKHKLYTPLSRHHLRILSDLTNQCRSFQLVYCDEELNNIPLLIERLLRRGK